MALIPEGSRLICPNNECQQTIALFADDVDTVTINISDLLEPEEGTTKEECEAVRQFCCPVCREKFIRVNGHVSFHTNYGWT
jgi:hypothetical protein